MYMYILGEHAVRRLLGSAYLVSLYVVMIPRELSYACLLGLHSLNVGPHTKQARGQASGLSDRQPSGTRVVSVAPQIREDVTIHSASLNPTRVCPDPPTSFLRPHLFRDTHCFAIAFRPIAAVAHTFIYSTTTTICKGSTRTTRHSSIYRL